MIGIGFSTKKTIFVFFCLGRSQFWKERKMMWSAQRCRRTAKVGMEGDKIFF